MLAPQSFNSVFLLALQFLVDLFQNKLLHLASETKLFSGFRDGARWQVEIDRVDDAVDGPLHVGHNQRLGELFPVCLVPSIVLYLDVKIE